MDPKPTMLLDERSAIGIGDLSRLRSGNAINPAAIPRVALLASAPLAEHLAASTQFEFIPYGAPDAAVLSGIRPFDIDAILIEFESGIDCVSGVMDLAGNLFVDLPAFVYCSLENQREAARFGWRLMAVDHAAALAEIEEKFQRALFLFPWLRCEVLRKILASLKTIPAEAASHQKLVQELQRPHYNIQRVAEMIKQDPALTAQLLKIVNSAAFAPRFPIICVDEAVARLGATKLQTLIVAAWAFFIIDDNVCPGFKPRHEWCHAVDIAGRVAKFCQLERVSAEASEAAIIAALLHDLGKPLLAANIPGDYARVLESARTNNYPLWQAENQMLGFNHAEIAGCLLGLWGVPLPVVEAVMLHHVENPQAGSTAALIQRAHEVRAPL